MLLYSGESETFGIFEGVSVHLDLCPLYEMDGSIKQK